LAICDVTYIFDGEVNTNHYLSKENTFKISKGTFGKDYSSYMFSIKYMAEQNLKDDDIIYFLEDDYIHKPGWSEILLEAFDELDAEYVTLYDHPDKYDKTLNGHLQCQILNTTSGHWRTAPSTTNTFAFRFRTLKRDMHILSKIWIDNKKYKELWNSGATLISSIPGYATHCESGLLSPVVDWESIINENV